MLAILAVEWIQKNGECIISVSPMNLIHGILSQLNNCRTKTEFVHGVIKGGAANLSTSARNSFAQMVCNFNF